ncbi:hypothetical protein F5B22DRAFT_385997 [Xylaria bambusicola]|uniref:uncharacterized protein n=1 Tax=Xylaria bambusicola TaxID=326684 RepID=UPI002007271E|nr:uncharacterized protein F5B22DRAFT_385997 [Xylaria bambusicola]KAI0508826.1 hypothetical protein F5B22DRAFT_385997 [Xylaria bambusicola]
MSGVGATCIKSPWYDLMMPYVSIPSIRTKEGYGIQRKRWDEALGILNSSSLGFSHGWKTYAMSS